MNRYPLDGAFNAIVGSEFVKTQSIWNLATTVEKVVNLNDTLPLNLIYTRNNKNRAVIVVVHLLV